MQSPLYENIRRLGGGFKYFCENVKINIYQGNVPINLMNLFPLLKQGYCKSNRTASRLIWSYIMINNLYNPIDENFIISDDLFNEAFGKLGPRNRGLIPALKYPYVKDFSSPANYSLIKQDEAIKIGLTSLPLSTFELLNLSYDHLKGTYFEFNPEMIYKKYILEMVDFNSESVTDIDDDSFNLTLKEYSMIGGIHEIFREIRNVRRIRNEDLTSRYTFEDFMYYILKRPEVVSRAQDYMYDILKGLDVEGFIYRSIPLHKLILNELTKDLWIRLLYGIIIKDIDIISEISIDPRINNNEAYRLALKTQNNEIIDLINRKILERKFIGYLAVTSMFESLIGSSDLPKTIFSNKL